MRTRKEKPHCYYCHRDIRGKPFVGPLNKKKYCNRKCAVDHQNDCDIMSRPGYGDYV